MRVGIIGLGVMGKALAIGMKDSHCLALFSRNQDKLASFAEKIGQRHCSTLEECVHLSEVIILAVKPKDLETVAHSLDPLITKTTLLLSILGGVSLATLKSNFSNGIFFSCYAQPSSSIKKRSNWDC